MTYDAGVRLLVELSHVGQIGGQAVSVSYLSGVYWLIGFGVIFGAVTLIGCILRMGTQCSRDEDGWEGK